jgi:hypothetical protein
VAATSRERRLISAVTRAAAAWVALCCVAISSTPAEAADATRAVLEPGAARVTARLANALAAAAEAPPPEVVLGETSVTFRFAAPPGQAPWEVVLTGPGPAGGAVTKHGTARLPEALAPERRDALIAALASVDPPLRWRLVSEPAPAVDYAVDAARAARVRAARASTRAARDDADAPPASAPPDPAALAAETAAVTALGLRDPEASVALGTLESRLRTTRGAPKLWAAAALEALRQGEPTLALAYADVATRMDHLDADALAAWRLALGSPPSAPPDAAVPEALPHPAPEALPPLLLWLALAGALWLAAAQWLAPAAPGRVFVLVGLGLAAASLLARPTAAPPTRPPPVPEALLAPLAGGACDADPALWTPTGWQLLAACDGAPTTFYITASTAPAGAPQVSATSDRPGPTVDAAARRLRDLVAKAGLDLRGRPPDPPAARVAPSPADRAERRLAHALAAASLPALLLVLWLAAASLFRAGRADRALALALAAALVLTLVTRALTPPRMVMEYTGYDLTARLASLTPLPRYGAGALPLYAPALELLGVDHRHVQWANRVLGALTLLPLTALAHRLTGGARLGTAVTALAFAALPVFWRDHSAEGIQTGATFLLMCGLAALATPPQPRAPHGALAALPLLAWAATCRPEVLPALPFAAAAALLVARPHGLRPRPLLLLAAALALALTPHLAWLAQSAARQWSESGISSPRQSLERIPGVLFDANIFLDGPWLPAACLAWLAASFASPARQRAAAALLALAALAWLAVTAVDLPRVSVPRVHLPALCLVLPLLGLGAAQLHRWPAATWLLALAALASTAWNAPAILALGNADAEESLIRTALAAAKQHPGACIATIASDDPPPPGKTPRQFPRYLFAGHPVTGLDAFDALRADCPGPAIAILGTRCSMAERAPDSPPPPAPATLPVCQRFAARHALEPIHRADIPNRTEHTFPMYPAGPTLTVGVYRVAGYESPEAPPLRGTP